MIHHVKVLKTKIYTLTLIKLKPKISHSLKSLTY